MATKNTQKIGWIGMGRMGQPMAERLLKAGHDVSVWNRTRAKAEPLAKIGGKVVGFLIGERQLHPPRGYFSYFFEPYSTAIPYHGHAVAPDADAVAVTRALYGALAEAWVRRGFFIHAVRIPAGDADLQEAWMSLGFGRKATCAVRPTWTWASGSSCPIQPERPAVHVSPSPRSATVPASAASAQRTASPVPRGSFCTTVASPSNASSVSGETTTTFWPR